MIRKSGYRFSEKDHAQTKMGLFTTDQQLITNLAYNADRKRASIFSQTPARHA
jgi:hypothetical protein